MFKYVALAFIILLSGCVERSRVIQVSRVDRDYTTNRAEEVKTPRVKRPKEPRVAVRERRVSRVKRVPIPENRPKLDIKVFDEQSGDGISKYGREERVSEPKLIQRMEFPEEEYMALPKFGNNEVSGRVYLINGEREEEIVKSNLKLYLNPVTSYSKQWYEESYLNGNKMTPPDRRLFNYLKFTVSGEGGNFSFF
ncbi:MAG: hypothetical protein GXO06_02525, partial [Epsilonproteobacteria bacterium]|nr:hypothetical protein [Campylobacterota bacterium]